jgi:hypothetical protein
MLNEGPKIIVQAFRSKIVQTIVQEMAKAVQKQCERYRSNRRSK